MHDTGKRAARSKGHSRRLALGFLARVFLSQAIGATTCNGRGLEASGVELAKQEGGMF
jgi:hypothetical protein